MNDREAQNIRRLERDARLLLLSLCFGALFFVFGSLSAKNGKVPAALVFFLLLALDHLCLGFIMYELILFVKDVWIGKFNEGLGVEEFPEVPSGVSLVKPSLIQGLPISLDKTPPAETESKNPDLNQNEAVPKEALLMNGASTDSASKDSAPKKDQKTDPKDGADRLRDGADRPREKQAIFKKGLLEEFDLYELCKGLCEKRDPAYPFAPYVSFRSDKPNLRIYSDKTAFELIFRNVLDNERKFASPDSRIEVTLSVIDDKEVLMIFRDNGIGPTEANPDLLFGLNYQGRNKRGGSGLGLSQVKAIADEWGGQAWIRTSPSQGFGLFVQIPIKKA